MRTLGMMRRMPLPAPTLHTSRLHLRPFAEADREALFALHSDAHVLRYWDSPPWRERSRADGFLAGCRRLAEEGTGARLAIDRVEDGAFVGWCSLTRWDPDLRSAVLTYCLTDSAWGQGYATEASRALLTWAFDTLDLNRVQTEADTRNAASARVLEKLGFVLEGTLREDCVVEGVVSDSWVFGLLRREWEVGRETPARPRERDRSRPVLEPGSTDDLRGLLLDYLDFYRSVVALKVRGLSLTDLRASRVPSGWTPAGLLTHLAFMERRWLQWGFQASPVPDPWGDGEGDGWVTPDVDVAALVASLDRVGATTRRIVEAHRLTDRASVGGRFATVDEAPQLHWVLLHVLQEYARHAGHLDIARELIDGAVGEDG